MKILTSILTDIKNGDNIDVYFAVLACFVIAGLDVFGIIQPEIITAATLLALGAILFGALATRKTLENLSVITQRLEGGRGAESFLKDRNSYVPLPEITKTARNIYLCGPTLINLFSQWSAYLQSEKLDNHGTTIQVILPNPNSSIKALAKWINEPPENTQRDIERTLSYIELIVKNGIKAGSIEARLIDFFPNFSMVLIDPDEPHGKIFVEFIGYGTKLHSRPHLELTKQRDGQWYEYFFQQYHNLWKDSQTKINNKV